MRCRLRVQCLSSTTATKSNQSSQQSFIRSHEPLRHCTCGRKRKEIRVCLGLGMNSLYLMIALLRREHWTLFPYRSLFALVIISFTVSSSRLPSHSC